jgi:hypothetical protein
MTDLSSPRSKEAVCGQDTGCSLKKETKVNSSSLDKIEPNSLKMPNMKKTEFTN